MDAMAPHITTVSIVSSTIFQEQLKELSKLRVTGLVRGIHRWPVDSPHKGPVTRKKFPLDDGIIFYVMSFNFVLKLLPHLPWELPRIVYMI